MGCPVLFLFIVPCLFRHEVLVAVDGDELSAVAVELVVEGTGGEDGHFAVMTGDDLLVPKGLLLQHAPVGEGQPIADLAA